MSRPKTDFEALRQDLHQVYEGHPWHGSSITSVLDGISAESAKSRPIPDAHNIWELVLHMAYWKYAVSRRISGVEPGSFPREGSDWIPVRDTSEKAWKVDIRLLHDQHALLVRAVQRLSPSRLHHRNGSRWTHAEQIAGAAAHDLYHTGQLQLIKKLSAARASRGR